LAERAPARRVTRKKGQDGSAGGPAIWGALFGAFANSERSLQVRIRQMIVAAIESGRIPAHARMPSSRELAQWLGVARNTVVLAYQQLVDEGLLAARQRSGYFIARPTRRGEPPPAGAVSRPAPAANEAFVDWPRRFAVAPSSQRNIVKPRDWLAHPYPFLYGQFDRTLFPTNDWRECARAALSVLEIHNWARDMIDGDDPELVDQLRLHVLPRRGIWARPDELIVTLGAQQALFLLAQLLLRPMTPIGVEDPGYPDARNIFLMMGAQVRPLPIDAQGLIVSPELARCQYLYVTAGHQCPTTVALAPGRREALIALARRHDLVIIEDDYESDLGSDPRQAPALKSVDQDGRVLYVGSLSKVLAPGLRLGFIVGPEPVVRELRALRRLMLRHPPANNQRAVALFLGLGHYKSHVWRVGEALQERGAILESALERHLHGFSWTRAAGASSFWLAAPEGIDAGRLAQIAQTHGVLVERGDVFFMRPPSAHRFLRLGFSSIPAERIEAGVAALAESARSIAA
jgi:GntR family transcriptional regulator/MocR family aminotransferase